MATNSEVITGIGGSVKIGESSAVALADAQRWSLEITCEIKPFNSSTTGRWTKRNRGNMSWTGTVEAYWQTGSKPTVRAGMSVAVELHTPSTSYVGTAVIARQPIECDIEGGENMGYSIELEGDGQLAAEEYAT